MTDIIKAFPTSPAERLSKGDNSATASGGGQVDKIPGPRGPIVPATGFDVVNHKTV
jgi:hypothetical protein